MPKKVTCCVRYCKTKNQEVYKLFPLPCGNGSQVEAHRRRTWLNALGLPPRLPSRHLRVCSKHFCCDDFEDLKYSTQKFLRLKLEAVPHLHVPNASPCYFENKKASPNLLGVIVPTKSIAHLVGEKTENDDSVYLVQQCADLKTFTNYTIGVPTPPKFTIQQKQPENRLMQNISTPSTALPDRDIKVALPGFTSTFPLCRICYTSAFNKKTDPSIDYERDDVKTIKNMLSLLLPTSKWEMYRNPVICDICLDIVKKSFNLIQSYIATTESLNNLFENTKSSVPTNVDLVIMRKTAPGAKISTVKLTPAASVTQPLHTTNSHSGTSSSLKKIKMNHHKIKQCVKIKRTNPEPLCPKKIRKLQPSCQADKTFSCCVCYETFPDSKTLMAHLHSNECTGPRQKCDLVITGL